MKSRLTINPLAGVVLIAVTSNRKICPVATSSFDAFIAAGVAAVLDDVSPLSIDATVLSMLAVVPEHKGEVATAAQRVICTEVSPVVPAVTVLV